MQRASFSLSEEQRQALRAEQLRLLIEARPFNIVATLAIAVVVAAILVPITTPSRILLWCGLLLLAYLVRAGLIVAWHRDSERLQRINGWWWYMLLASVVTGAGWGVCNALLFSLHDPLQQMLAVFITCGISAAAAVSLAADPRIAWSFVIPCVLPLQLQFLLQAGEAGLSLGVMLLVYLILLAGVISRQHNYIRDNILLRIAGQERERLQNDFAQVLRTSQEKLQALFELSPLGCSLMRTDGSLVQANRSFQQMLGYASAEDFEERFSALLTPAECHEENRRRWRQFIERGGAETLECDFVRKDGSLMPATLHRMVFDTGDGQHFVWVIVEDISERKRHEQQLQALNNRLSLATQAGKIGIWELDLVHNTQVWDARMCEIYGVEPDSDESSPEASASFVHPDDWQAVKSSYETALHNPAADRHVMEFRIVLRDDSERWVRAAGLIQRDATGRAQRIIGVTWDITELKRVARMKSAFVSSVSHELRTPLTSIRGSLGLVANGVVGEIPAAARELIDIAYKNSERLSLLINDILDIEKIESGKIHLDLRRHELGALIAQAVEANKGYAQNFAVQLVLSGDTQAEVVVDADRFMQVMANLISNAVKFSNAGDIVEVAVVDTPERTGIEVRDRGPGIPAAFRERIFQRFSQADASDTRARGGSGLGLAITRALVEKMHGTIGFVDRSGGGTVFFVELPR